jgi:eukaryotic-like serine/threonine-protein kinase
VGEALEAGCETLPSADERRTATVERGTRIGRYLALSRVGSGAMGVVWSAYDPELDRKVAIKIVLAAGDDQAGVRSRLQREAQALARLAHPNVVTVHDVGSLDGGVWIAMELIDGATLGDWIAQTRPGVSALLDVLARAGAGLAAAHAAGLVHRDIKPSNLMLARDAQGGFVDARVLVMDFGLADDPSSGDPDDGAMTRPGMMVGTPAYMAPEQHLGLPVDARSDQFGFCVTAWEALYGERPFTGDSLAQLALAVTEGRRRPAPRRGVSSAIRRALERGMAPDPSRRFVDMAALLAALARARTRRRRMLAVAVFAAIATLAGTAVAASARAKLVAISRCETEGAGIAQVWPGPDGAEHERLADAFERSGSALASGTMARIVPRLDAWAEQWSTTSREECEAFEVEHTRDAGLHTRAIACLEEHRQAVAVLLGVLAEADDGTVQGAVGAVADLIPPPVCADDARLLARSESPADADVDEIAGLQRELDRVRSLRAAGRPGAARSLAEQLLPRAEAIGWPPLAIEARLELAVSIDEAGDPAAAEPLLVDSYVDALATGHDELAIDAAQQLVFVVGYELARTDEGLMWGRHGEGFAHRPGTDPLRAARLSSAIATVAAERGELDEAQSRYREVLATMTDELGPDHPRLADLLSNVAMLEAMRGDHETAEAHYLEALALAQDAFGPDHPTVASLLSDVAIARVSRGDAEGALPLFERALAIRESALGPRHPLVAAALNNLAGTHRMLGDARAAEPLLRRALEILEATIGPEHPDLGAPLVSLGGLVHERGDLEGAERLFTRALQVRERGLGPANPALAEPLAALAWLALGRGHAAAAVPLAERALELRRDAPPLQIGESHFVLARALCESGGDCRRGVELAQLAIIDFADEQPPRQRAEIEQWLRDDPTAAAITAGTQGGPR